jgi:antitoxin (DNA-binding transcriptional repressor) of toxin-antitoxin stability system
MTTHTIGEFKARFSDILEEVRRGAVVGVRYGRGRKPVAVLVPPDQAPRVAPRQLGPLQGKASFRLKRAFKMSDAELLGS